MVIFRTLGEVSLTAADGRELRSVLAQPKRLALLAYLASPRTPEFVPRELLLGLLWTEREEKRARHALRSSLYYLRRSVGPEVVVSRGGQDVGLDPARLRCDAAELEVALKAGEDAQALDLYGGDYLQGLVVEGALEFERWLERERRRLRLRARDAARRLAQAALMRCEFAEAERRARRAAALDSWDEAILRLLMRTLALQGNRAGALRVYERFAGRMREELRLEPSPDTAALVARIRDGGLVAGRAGAAESRGTGRSDGSAAPPGDSGPSSIAAQQLSPKGPRDPAPPARLPRAGGGADRRRKQVFVTLGALAVGLAAVLAWRTLEARGGAPADPGLTIFSLTDDPALRIAPRMSSPFAVSPDGRTIVFRGSTDTTPPQLWVRHIAEPWAHPLKGTEGAMNPAISPDGTWVAFTAADEKTVRKVRITGGDPITIAKLNAFTAALSWASNNEVLCEQWGPDLGIQRVDAAGGKPVLLVPLDTAAGEVAQRMPLVLHGEATVIAYASYLKGRDKPELALYRLSDGRRAQLGIPGMRPLALVDDHLIYARMDGTLMAVPLDLHDLETSGQPVALEPRVRSAGVVGPSVGLSAGGTLVYRLPSATPTSRLELVDTAGVEREIPGTFTIQGAPRFSPDGRRIVIASGGGAPADWVENMRRPADLWVIDLATGSPTRLTSDQAAAAPAWFPDGRRLAYSALVRSRWELWSLPADGSAPPSRLAKLPENALGASLLPEGHSAVIVTGGFTHSALVRIRLDGSGPPDTLVATDGDGQVPAEPRISPNGRWVAYENTPQPFTADVWVRSMSGRTALQVSVSGTGGKPVVWGPDSRRLYYQSLDGLVEIELRTRPTLAVVRRRTIRTFSVSARSYDLSPDGRTFVVAEPVNAAADVLVDLHWISRMRRTWNGGGAG